MNVCNHNMEKKGHDYWTTMKCTLKSYSKCWPAALKNSKLQMSLDSHWSFLHLFADTLSLWCIQYLCSLQNLFLQVQIPALHVLQMDLGQGLKHFYFLCAAGCKLWLTVLLVGPNSSPFADTDFRMHCSFNVSILPSPFGGIWTVLQSSLTSAHWELFDLVLGVWSQIKKGLHIVSAQLEALFRSCVQF